MKAVVLLTGASIGIAASLVVISFQQALSPFFGFVLLVGVAFWLRDVRRSPPGSRGPNWRNFFLGSTVWFALAIGALLFKNWLASVPASAASPSAVGAGLLAFGIAVVALGAYGFLGHPSQRVIENWARLDGYMPIFGMFSAAVPLGMAMVILGALALSSPPQAIAPLIVTAFTSLIFVGIFLMFWQPQWTKPPWLRQHQGDAKSNRSGHARVSGH